MPKRIKLLIDLSGFEEGISHLIYRSDAPPVPTDQPLIEAEEREVIKRSLLQTGEVLEQFAESPFDFRVRRVFQLSPLPKVYIDGVEIPSQDVLLFPQERRIRIYNQPIEPDTDKVITMDYYYLASVITDDPTVTQLGVTHHGTTVITGLNPPIFRDYLFDASTKELKIRIDEDRTPHEAWYRVAYRDNKNGRISTIAPEQSIQLVPNPYDLRYRLEVSKDNKATWQFVTEFTGHEVVLSNVSDITDKGYTPLTVQINRVSPTKAELLVQNPWYQWQIHTRPTFHYRIREEDGSGQASEYTELPVGGVNYKPVQLKIRRKEHNGTPANYDGFDALDLWTITESQVNPLEPYIRLTDDHLVSGRTYSYTFYVDDEEGLRSEPFMAIAYP